MEFIGFLIAEVEAIMKKYTFFGGLINQQCYEQDGECWVAAMHDIDKYLHGWQVLFLPLLLNPWLFVPKPFQNQVDTMF